MAGSYPDTPSRRIAWDADGTVLLDRPDNNASPQVEISAQLMAELNDEDLVATGHAGLGHTNRTFTFIFPELREFDGIFIATPSGNGTVIEEVETSGDTTNGIDGSWATEIANYTDQHQVTPQYRDEITAVAASNVRGIRCGTNTVGTGAGSDVYAVHLYGEIAPGETPDRLLWIDEATGLEFTKPIDYGDIPRGGSEDVEVRLRNNSAALTATTIQYTAEALYLGSAAWYTFSLPGGATFQNTQQVASLAPATSTGIITVRRITPGDETLGLHAARLYANVASWS